MSAGALDFSGRIDYIRDGSSLRFHTFQLCGSCFLVGCRKEDSRSHVERNDIYRFFMYAGQRPRPPGVSPDPSNFTLVKF